MVSREESFAEKLSEVEELKGIPGILFKSSESVELTESETEYVIKCVKHSFNNHLVLQVYLKIFVLLLLFYFLQFKYAFLFQFNVLNTLSDQLLENVKVAVEPAEGFNIVKEVPIAKLSYGETGHCYVALEYPEEILACVGRLKKCDFTIMVESLLIIVFSFRVIRCYT